MSLWQSILHKKDHRKLYIGCRCDHCIAGKLHRQNKKRVLTRIDKDDILSVTSRYDLKEPTKLGIF